MRGLEKMIQQIEAQAQAQADELLRSAQAQAEQIRSEEKARREQALARIAERSARELAACQARGDSSLDQQRRMALLAAKQEIIAQLLADALQTLQAWPAEEYFAAVLKLAERYVRPMAGRMLLAKADLDRFPQGYGEKLAAIARDRGGSLTISGSDRVSGGGFVLVYGGVEENCTFPALFDARREELQDLAHRLLFA